MPHALPMVQTTKAAAKPASRTNGPIRHRKSAGLPLVFEKAGWKQYGFRLLIKLCLLQQRMYPEYYYGFCSRAGLPHVTPIVVIAIAIGIGIGIETIHR